MVGIDDLALRTRELRKRFGAITALDGLSLAILRGEIYGLLGANGAGKTTALRIVCGLLQADAGDGHCLGRPLGTTPAGLGYMPQRGGLYDDLSVAENLRFFARAQGLRRPEAAVVDTLEKHHLGARAAQRVGVLSGGWRQRVALAASLLHEPKLLLLDEPSAGLDPLAREALWRRLRALTTLGTTVLVTTHYADEAERCDRIGYLDAGRLRIEGAPDRIAEQVDISVWRVDPEVPSPPPMRGMHCLRDAAGWRVIAKREVASPAFTSWLEDARGLPEPARLADALSWLAADEGAGA